MDTQPKLVASYQANVDGSIQFRTHTELITIKEHVAVIQAVLELCDGMHPASAIVKTARKSNPDYTEEIIQDIIEDLYALDVLADSRRLGEWFHTISSNPMPYYHSLTPTEIKTHLESPRADLIQGEATRLPTLDTVLTEMLRTRRSCRSFDGQPLSVESYSYLLRSAYGMGLYPVPSGGALYPLSLYLIVTNGSEELPEGLYQYDPEKHEIIASVREYDEYEVSFALNSESALYGASGVFVIAADLHRHNAKYSNRGYRYSLIEVGHAAQNMLLAAVDAGIETLEYGGFRDTETSELFDMGSRGEFPVIVIAVGKVNPEPSGEDSTTTRVNLEETYVGRREPVNWVNMVVKEADKQPPFQMAIAHYKPGTHQDPASTYRGRLALGTALSSDLAMVKAVAEAYERHVCGQVYVDRVDRAADLECRWVDPNRNVPFTNNQMKHLGFERFSPDRPWEWVEGEASDGEVVYVPADMVFYPFAADKHYGRRNCYSAHSNGVAAHTSIQEAKRRALLELVERDAIIRNWLAKSVPLRFHPDSLPRHWQKRVSHWAEQGWKVEIIDLSRPGIAVVCVFAVANDVHSRPYITHGSSASERNLDEAISKAFHEMEVGLAIGQGRRRPRITPKAVDTPEDHGKLYYYPEHAGELAYLFSGGYVESVLSVGTVDLVDAFDPVFVVLTEQESLLHVVRAVSDRLVPINFGYGRDHVSHHLLKEVIEPVPFPHYLA